MRNLTPQPPLHIVLERGSGRRWIDSYGTGATSLEADILWAASAHEVTASLDEVLLG
jgi:hypothetical protein